MRLLSPRPLAATLLLCAVLTAQAAPPPQAKPMSGFGAPRAERQRALEARFDALLKKENLRGWMRRLSARPHQVGSPHGRDNAEFTAGLFRSWGYDVHLETFDVLFPTPKVRVLELTAPARYAARLSEPALEEDATSSQTPATRCRCCARSRSFRRARRTTGRPSTRPPRASV